MYRIGEKTRKYVEKVKQSNWQGPLGTALKGTATVVDLGYFNKILEIFLIICLVGGFPGSGCVASALRMGGAALANKATAKEEEKLR